MVVLIYFHKRLNQFGNLHLFCFDFRVNMGTIRHRGHSLKPTHIINLPDPVAQASGQGIFPFLYFMKGLEAAAAHKPRLPILSAFGNQNTNPPCTVANQKSGVLAQCFPHEKKSQFTVNKCPSSLSRIAQLVPT